MGEPPFDRVVPLRRDMPVRDPLWIDDADWVEHEIRPRPWIAPGYLMRGAATLVGGQGSAGKSSLCCAWAVALALGQRIGRFAPRRPATTLLYNVEDDLDEQRRRLSAALRQVNEDSSAIRGRITRAGPDGVGTLLELDPATNALRETAAMQRLAGHIEALKPDVVMLDPLIELHTADENDNAQLRRVLAHFRALGQRLRCAIVLVHHTRKGSMAGDMDSLRGAGSIVGAARMVFTVATMTEDEAKKLGVEVALRRQYFRVDSAKSNYAPAAEADWHRMVECVLDNSSEEYPEGDRVAAAVAWTPPVTATPEKAPELLAMIEAAIERGFGGEPYSDRMSEGERRSIMPVLAAQGITDSRGRKALMDALRQRGVERRPYINAKGNVAHGLRAKSGRPAVRWVEDQA